MTGTADKEKAMPMFVHEPKPYCCPVCHGRGIVPAGFYSHLGYVTSTAPEKCRSCGGSGIVRA